MPSLTPSPRGTTAISSPAPTSPSLHDAEVRAEAGRVVEAVDEPGVAHADPELEARLARLRHLELGAPDPPPGPDHQRAEVDALRR